ncbi:MAG: MaoC/PaaZ C-terminal domain-containing protein [Thermocladium sp.]
MVLKAPPYSFDDFEVGMKIRSHGLTITEAHIIQFAGLTGDFNPIHLNAEFAGKSIFKERVAHGLLTLSVAVGQFAQLIAGTTIALLEVNSRFHKPVKIGDTIYVESEVISKVPSNKYNGGVVVLKHDVKNQFGELVASIETKLLISNGPATSENVFKHTDPSNQ